MYFHPWMNKQHYRLVILFFGTKNYGMPDVIPDTCRTCDLNVY